MILSLVDTVTNPVESHIHGLGPFLLDSVIGDAVGCSVVSLDRHWQLWVAQFF